MTYKAIYKAVNHRIARLFHLTSASRIHSYIISPSSRERNAIAIASPNKVKIQPNISIDKAAQGQSENNTKMPLNPPLEFHQDPTQHKLGTMSTVFGRLKAKLRRNKKAPTYYNSENRARGYPGLGTTSTNNNNNNNMDLINQVILQNEINSVYASLDGGC